MVAIWVLLLTARICGRYTGNPINRVRWCVWQAAVLVEALRERSPPATTAPLLCLLIMPTAASSTLLFFLRGPPQDGCAGAQFHRGNALLLPHANVSRGSSLAVRQQRGLGASPLTRMASKGRQ